jgi:hypothetical protein
VTPCAPVPVSLSCLSKLPTSLLGINLPLAYRWYPVIQGQARGATRFGILLSSIRPSVRNVQKKSSTSPGVKIPSHPIAWILGFHSDQLLFFARARSRPAPYNSPASRALVDSAIKHAWWEPLLFCSRD